jgi:hypothetical protein
MNRYEIAMGKKHSEVVLGKAKGQYDVPAGALKKCVLQCMGVEVEGFLIKLEVNNVVRNGYKVLFEVESKKSAQILGLSTRCWDGVHVGEYLYLKMKGQTFKIIPTEFSFQDCSERPFSSIITIEGNMPLDGVISTNE